MNNFLSGGLAAIALLLSPTVIANDALVAEFPVLSGQSATLVDVLSQVDGSSGVMELNPIEDAPFIQVVTDANEVFYLDNTGRYLFTGGEVVDIKNEKMLTSSKESQLKAIAWDSLPFEYSFNNGVNSDKYRIAVFTDVDCPYCTRLERILSLAPDVEVHYFMNPLASIHPDAVATSEKIMCSDNPFQAMKDYMLMDQAPSDVEVTQACKDFVAGGVAFAGSKGINSTPTIFLENGERVEGAPSDIVTLKNKIDDAMGR